MEKSTALSNALVESPVQAKVPKTIDTMRRIVQIRSRVFELLISLGIDVPGNPNDAVEPEHTVYAILTIETNVLDTAISEIHSLLDLFAELD